MINNGCLTMTPGFIPTDLSSSMNWDSRLTNLYLGFGTDDQLRDLEQK